MEHGKYQLSVALLVVASLSAAGCNGAEEPSPMVEVSAPHVLEARDSVFAGAPERVTLAQERIYFTLHEHAWYARGEPLLYGTAAYQPAGMPVAASLPEMRHVGDYQGVDLYVRDGDEDALVYVPVFEGYWQAFRPDTARPAN